MAQIQNVDAVRSVSFSGIDGAGKSTQIERLCAQLEKRGMRVRVLRFWDDIAALTALREQTGHKVFKGERGIGTPAAPVNRRDKNVRGWPMTCLRLLLYFLDALSLRRVYRSAHRRGADFIIFDRYTYDELANLNLNLAWIRAYARFIEWLIPKPDISFVLDADPEAARARKPEYPLDFLRFNREAYLRLSHMFALTVVPTSEIAEAHRAIFSRTLEILATDTIVADGRDSNHVQDSSAMDAPSARPAIF